jgi:hypothetical protein
MLDVDVGKAVDALFAGAYPSVDAERLFRMMIGDAPPIARHFVLGEPCTGEPGCDVEHNVMPVTCSWCGFDSVCHDCWHRDGSIVCHSCSVEGRDDPDV